MPAQWTHLNIDLGGNLLPFSLATRYQGSRNYRPGTSALYVDFGFFECAVST